MQGAVAAWRDLLDDRTSIPRPPVPGRALRSRAVFFCVLPAALLGATYFLLVEFVLKESAGQPLRIGWLRWGGLGLATLAVVLAMALGWVIADGFRRPLRTLLRVAEGGNGGNGGLDPAIMLSLADADLRRLTLRIHTLAQQNRAGAEAMREHARLQEDLVRICGRIMAAAQEGRWPGPAGEGASAEGARVASGIDRLMERLRERVQSVEKRLEDIEARLGEKPLDGRAPDGMGNALRNLERLGTVWSLEMEIARRRVPEMPGELGEKLQTFNAALDAVRRAAQKNGNRIEPAESARSDVALLREEIHDWLRPGGMPASADERSASRGEVQDD